MFFQSYDFRVKYFDAAIIKIRDMGIIDSFFSKWRSPKNMKEHITLPDEPLVIEHFLLSIIIWFVGLALAMVLFLRETSCLNYLKGYFVNLPI